MNQSTIYIPFLVCIIGLILALFCRAEKAPRAIRIGEIMFGVGLLVTLLQLAAIVVK